jgi:hypothetical protein
MVFYSKHEYYFGNCPPFSGSSHYFAKLRVSFLGREGNVRNYLDSPRYREFRSVIQRSVLALSGGLS